MMRGLAIAQDGVVKLVNAGHIAPYLNGEQLAMEGCASPKLHPVIVMTGLLNPTVILERMMRK
jgi:hypothetical protein